jgi:tetratricopeptide (TPR) repeat protein|eukprot:COSAG01_NODE_1748_length_9329_cov_99.035861_4_plen_98_part_00
MRRYGNLLRVEGRLAESVASYQRAVTVDPTTATAYVGLGLTYQEMQKSQEALASFSIALHRDPVSPAAWYEHGRLSLPLAASVEPRCLLCLSACGCS